MICLLYQAASERETVRWFGGVRCANRSTLLWDVIHRNTTNYGLASHTPTSKRRAIRTMLRCNARGRSLTIETRNITVDEQFARAWPPILQGQYILLAVTDTGHGMDAGPALLHAR